MVKTAFIYHEHCELHDMGEEHPESPARTKAIRDRLSATGLLEKMTLLKAKKATREQVLRVHHETYVEQLDRISPTHGLIQADPDTMMGPHTWEASYLAAVPRCRLLMASWLANLIVPSARCGRPAIMPSLT